MKKIIRFAKLFTIEPTIFVGQGVVDKATNPASLNEEREDVELFLREWLATAVKEMEEYGHSWNPKGERILNCKLCLVFDEIQKTADAIRKERLSK